LIKNTLILVSGSGSGIREYWKKPLKKKFYEEMDLPEEIPGSGVEFLFRLLHNIIAVTATESTFTLREL
jgi:hypothetical protein